MPVYLTAEAKFHGEPARAALKAYGVKDPKLVGAVWDLDNTDPEHIKIDFLPGSEIKNCLGAVYDLALISGHKVTSSANGLRFTADPLQWSKKADTERVVRDVDAAHRPQPAAKSERRGTSPLDAFWPE